ncbi:MAG: hypothetical protein K6F56_06630 [Oscillospiraceae bacterium]|nr:hypothetical protein [Oscillospiraceae bacterium]
MKIILVCQAEADTRPGTRCDSAGFARACEEEAAHGIAPVSVKKSDARRYRIHTGTGRAAQETAALLFDFTEAPERTPLLDEVALRPFRDTDAAYPLRLWEAVGTAQWALGSGRQAESRRETLERVGRFVDTLEEEDRDCIVVCRGRTLAALKTVLRRRGWCIEGGELRPKPLDRIRATKRTLHCGGCHHNCLLTEPKCQIGRAKAQDRGI